MSKSEIYKKHWDDQAHLQNFIAFKNFTLKSEDDFAIQCAQILAKSLTRDQISVLDIGVGNGLVTNYFLQEFRKHKIVENYLGIELSADLIKEALDKLKTLQSVIPVKIEHADALTFELKQKVDLIIAFNSWYGIPFERIISFQQSLAPAGVLAVLLNSELNLTIDVTHKFKPEESVTSSEQLMRWLDLHNIKFESHLITTQFTTRDSFLDNGALKEDSVKFFEYLLRGEVKDTQSIANYIKDKPDVYFNLPQHLILIAPPSVL